MKAASCASAMRAPGGGSAACAARLTPMRGGEASARIASRSSAALGHIGKRVEPRIEIAMLARLHQAEMPLGQSERLRRAAPRREWESANRRWRRPPAADAGRCRPGSARRRRCARRGSWPAKPRTSAAADCDCPDTSSTSSTGRPITRGKIGRGPGAARLQADAVEQAHDAFDDEDVASGRRRAHQPVEQRGRHGPAVEIDACPPRRRPHGTPGRYSRARPWPPARASPRRRKAASSAERHRGLAGAGARRGDDQRRRGHGPLSLRDGGPSGAL